MKTKCTNLLLFGNHIFALFDTYHLVSGVINFLNVLSRFSFHISHAFTFLHMAVLLRLHYITLICFHCFSVPLHIIPTKLFPIHRTDVTDSRHCQNITWHCSSHRLHGRPLYFTQFLSFSLFQHCPIWWTSAIQLNLAVATSSEPECQNIRPQYRWF